MLRRSEEWVLGPGADYEVSGDVPNVVFPCGLVHDQDSDKLFLYYGAADTRIGLATARCSEVIGLPAWRARRAEPCTNVAGPPSDTCLNSATRRRHRDRDSWEAAR